MYVSMLLAVVYQQVVDFVVFVVSVNRSIDRSRALFTRRRLVYVCDIILFSFHSITFSIKYTKHQTQRINYFLLMRLQIHHFLSLNFSNPFYFVNLTHDGYFDHKYRSVDLMEFKLILFKIPLQKERERENRKKGSQKCVCNLQNDEIRSAG